MKSYKEMLEECAKGTKLRHRGWVEGQFVVLSPSASRPIDEEGKILQPVFWDFEDYEIYVEPVKKKTVTLWRRPWIIDTEPLPAGRKQVTRYQESAWFRSQQDFDLYVSGWGTMVAHGDWESKEVEITE